MLYYKPFMLRTDVMKQLYKLNEFLECDKLSEFLSDYKN